MSTDTNQMPFMIGETVIEPSLGICTIQGIRPMQIDGVLDDYFIFQSVSARVMVPRSQLARRGIRRPMSKDTIRRLLNMLREPAIATRGQARTQYLEYQEVLRSGNPTRIGKLLRNLYLLEQTDELKGKEKEIMEQARKFLVDEITFIRGESKTRTTEAIDDSLRQMVQKKNSQEKAARKAEKALAAKSA